MGFKEIKAEELSFNVFTTIAKDWMLITAGDEKGVNTMTASWGGMGHIWNKNVATVYIRPQRYTRKFVEEQEKLTISVLADSYRKELVYLGRVSGKDEDKIAKCGLDIAFEEGAPYIEQAQMVMVLRKLYVDTIKPEGFLDESIDGAQYPEKDYHYMYIAEIEKVLIKED